MSRRDSAVRLRHMLDYAQEAIALVQGRTRSDLDGDRLLNLAVVRLIEMIGEAANRVPLEERGRYQGGPWAQIVGMRNRLVHGDDLVDMDVLWQTMVQDLPDLAEVLQRALPGGYR